MGNADVEKKCVDINEKLEEIVKLTEELKTDVLKISGNKKTIGKIDEMLGIFDSEYQESRTKE